MKKLILLTLLLASCNPACDPSATNACREMCGAAGVAALTADGCRCQPSVGNLESTNSESMK